MILMRDNLKDIKLELFESQGAIIRLQSEVIDELFRLLCLHLEPEDFSKLPVIDKINEAAMIRAEHQL